MVFAFRSLFKCYPHVHILKSFLESGGCEPPRVQLAHSVFKKVSGEAIWFENTELNKRCPIWVRSMELPTPGEPSIWERSSFGFRFFH